MRTPPLPPTIPTHPQEPLMTASAPTAFRPSRRTLLDASVPATEMGVLDCPFVFANEKEDYTVLDGAFGQRLHGLLVPKNLVGLSYWEQGFRQIHTGKKAIQTADDLKGMKIRVIETPIYVDFMN